MEMKKVQYEKELLGKRWEKYVRRHGVMGGEWGLFERFVLGEIAAVRAIIWDMRDDLARIERTRESEGKK